MRISRIETFIVHVPLKSPIADSTNSIDHWGFAGVVLHTDTGLKGYGFTGTHAFLPGDQQITRYIDRVYGPLLIGEIVESQSCIERIWRKLHDAPPLRWIGRAGLSHLALAAVDIAIWDLFAKSLDLPLWKVLHRGEKVLRLEAYNTDSGWLSLGTDALVSGCMRSIDQGFRGVKIKVGSANPSDDLARIEAVRKAIGPKQRLMIDVNGKWSLETASKLATHLDAHGLFWCEEPLYFDDVVAHAELAKVMRTPMALGEQLYSRFHFEAFLSTGAMSFVQVDAVRVGGITEWLVIADRAHQLGVSVVAHVGDMMQVHQHTAFAHPACSLLEFIPWTQHCFKEPATVRNGEFVLPQAPGAGTTLTEEALGAFGKPTG
ncbi:MAG: mandelate racemase/muconate lactonizing enzyme family protein [Steroidobacteraceae bacterium]